MAINYLLIGFAILLLGCIIQCSNKGVVRVLFSLISWVFVLWFINFATPFISDEIYNRTNIDQKVQITIQDRLGMRYDNAEKENPGSGVDALMSILPNSIKNEVNKTIDHSVERVIEVISEELTVTAIRGVSIIIAVVLGYLISIIVGKIFNFIGNLPGLRGLNRIMGLFAGIIEAFLITWLIMYVADCFPTSVVGSYIIDNSQTSSILSYIYENNLIEIILDLK